jgi:hypothetical protein
LKEFTTAVKEPQVLKTKVAKAPRLVAEQLSLDTPHSLSLKLKVAGEKLIYKKLKTNEHNELNIAYQTPQREIHASIEEFSDGETVSFTLAGKGIIAKTYHFTVYYGDSEGNLYTQQIAGMGKEYPIIEPPKQIA